MNLNQVTLPATNVERSADFYRRMGFTQIVSALPRYARFECRDGATFSLHAFRYGCGGRPICKILTAISSACTTPEIPADSRLGACPRIRPGFELKA
jgi:catechol 2,3-dioxygenase-like lactoylglutathione lyase family enzyme